MRQFSTGPSFIPAAVRGVSGMAKLQLYGLGVLACGAITGFATGGPIGLVCASICLIVGLVMVVASEARGTKPERGPSSTAKLRTRLMVGIKEVHARPHQGGKFRAIHDPDQPDLELEVFLRCWLVNETDLPFRLESLQLELQASDGCPRGADHVRGDFGHWQLGALQEEWKDWDMQLRVSMEDVAELDIAEPLECGLAREGWLHFRFRDVTPSEFRSAPMQLSIRDSLAQVHVASASCVRHLPGRIWPVLVTRAAASGASTELATS
jgi:hypothetical protein